MAGERLFICSPSYSGAYCHQYVESLVATVKDCGQHQIPTAYKSLHGVHWIDIARDILAHVFLHSDCTHMLQIDDDLGWSADAPRRMLSRGADVIAGIYPIKDDSGIFPIAGGLPGGFLMVRREVIERMSEGKKYRASCLQFGEQRVASLFTRQFTDDSYVGEDFAFCRRARDAGFSLSAETDIDFVHVGRKAWAGNYSKA